jgi:hypothetical protein
MTTSNDFDRTDDRLSRIEALVEKNSQAIDRLTEDVKRWDDRFFQLSRDNLMISRTVIITAGTVVIISPVLQALAPAIETVVSRLLGIAQ